MAVTLYKNIRTIYPMAGELSGKQAKAVAVDNGWLTVKDDKIAAIGSGESLPPAQQIVDLGGMIVTPGLIDAHTHGVFAGDRSDEYDLRLLGVDYLEILARGGGILSTVKATRQADSNQLKKDLRRFLKKALHCGVTTMEIKSGYGLDLATEVRQLKVIKKAATDQPVNLVATYLGAHALPPEFCDNHDYLAYCARVVLPAVRPLAEFCDIFVDQGAFDGEQALWYLKQAKKLGFKLKLHIDEFVNLNGSRTAVALGATSVDHGLVTTKQQMAALAAAGITMVLLPVSSFNLGKAYARADLMAQAGLTLALGSDYNPGSCPCDDYLLTLRLASRVYGLPSLEVLAMATINAAKALAREKSIGSLETGKQADFVVMQAGSFSEVIARMDTAPIKEVYIKGKKVYSC